MQTEIEQIFGTPPAQYTPEHFSLFSKLKQALNAGTVRAAEPDPSDQPSGWRVNAWVKKGILVGFRMGGIVDMSIDFKFVTRSTIHTRETGEFEGKTYPLAKIEVSSESHPFYTGQQKIMDTAGRVEKFNKKFGTRATGKAAAK